MTSSSNRRGGRLLTLSIACALGLPLAAQAQTQATTGTSVSEQQLEQRVDQLEQEVAQLKSMIQAQKVTSAQAATVPANSAQNVAAATAATESAPTFTSAPGISVALHGFIDATAFSQSKSFTYGNGQNAEYPAAGANGSLSGVDVRNTRFWLDFSGAKFAGDWVGGGRIEMDFFGGNNGTGAYSQQQPLPRLRQAYMDLGNPETGSTIQIGQQWDLMFPLDNLAPSLAHIAFPLGYGTGVVGWRFPGVIWMQELNHGSSGPIWRLDLGAFEGSWNGPDGAVNNTNYLTAGNVGFRPQIEARLHVQDKNWLAYAVAHYSQVDLRGVGNTAAAPIQSQVKSVGYEVGGSWKPGPWVFRASAYSGRGLGEIFGDLSQFGDIKDTGGYVQAGYNFTPNWSANAFYGMSKPNTNDVIRWMGNGATGLLENRQTAVNVDYASGAYELGVEWLYGKLDSTTNGNNRIMTEGNQVSVSALYHF
jgi:outer membrane murein-binding lipoprotein Lpp